MQLFLNDALISFIGTWGNLGCVSPVWGLVSNWNYQNEFINTQVELSFSYFYVQMCVCRGIWGGCSDACTLTTVNFVSPMDFYGERGSQSTQRKPTRTK